MNVTNRAYGRVHGTSSYEKHVKEDLYGPSDDLQCRNVMMHKKGQELITNYKLQTTRQLRVAGKAFESG